MAIKRTAFRDLAEESKRLAEAGDHHRQLHVPTMEERVLIFLRATEAKEDFTDDECMVARSKILDAMADDIVPRSQPDESHGEAMTPAPFEGPEEPLVFEDREDTKHMSSVVERREESHAWMSMRLEEELLSVIRQQEETQARMSMRFEEKLLSVIRQQEETQARMSKRLEEFDARLAALGRSEYASEVLARPSMAPKVGTVRAARPSVPEPLVLADMAKPSPGRLATPSRAEMRSSPPSVGPPRRKHAKVRMFFWGLVIFIVAGLCVLGGVTLVRISIDFLRVSAPHQAIKNSVAVVPVTTNLDRK